MDGPIRVLCVDDNKDSARTTGQLLELHGCEVRVCFDGPCALAMAAEFQPDVCIVDLNMPGMDGDELIAKLREQQPDHPTRYIALTAYWHADAFHRTHNVGVIRHFVKPVEPSELIDAVMNVEEATAV